jgi:hypothetical protein
MNDQESQLRIAQEHSSQLQKIDQQLSKISGQQQNMQVLQKLADEFSKSLCALDDHQTQLAGIETKLKELKTAQEALTDKGDEYLKKLEERCSQLEKLKSRIDWKTWRYDNGLRVTALIVIGLLLVFSILLLCSKFPVWKTSSDAKVSTREVVGSLSSSKSSTPLISFATPEIRDEVMLCTFQENDPPDASPPPENKDAVRSENLESPIVSSANDTQSAVPNEQTSGPIREDRVDRGSEQKATESGNELFQGFDMSIELKARRLAPDTLNENPTPLEHTPIKVYPSMSPDKAKVWSFAILALSIAILFGFAAFAAAKIARDE